MTAPLRRAGSAALAALLLGPLLAGGGCSDGGAGPGAPPVAGAPAAGSRPNVLVLTIDTVRADRLGCYGYGRNTTPNLDALAKRSVVFDHAFSNSSFTPPAHASILTSLYPGEHGLVHWSRHLADVPTAAELFKAAGYRTAAFTPIPTLLKLGLDRGFALATGPEPEVVSPDRVVVGDADAVMKLALPFLTLRDAERPFFSWVHFYDAHRPYARQGAEWSERFTAHDDPAVGATEAWYQLTPQRRAQMQLTPAQVQLIEDHYDGGLAFLDDRVGLLLEALSSAGVLESTVIVVVADHGEVFDEHEPEWFSHDPYLTEENIHIPLLLRLPGAAHAGLRVPDLVEQVDVLPTLLELTGVTPPAYMSGLSLAPTLEGRRLPRSFVAAETQRVDPSLGPPPPGKPPAPELTEAEVRAARDRQLMVRTGTRKFVYHEDRRSAALHAVDGSSPESKDLLEAEKETAASASAALQQWRDGRRAPPDGVEQPTLDDEERAFLDALGYTGGNRGGPGASPADKADG